MSLRSIRAGAVSQLAAAALAAGTLFCASPASAQAIEGMGREEALKLVKLHQRLNEQVPADVTFYEEGSGRPVQLAEYFGKKPVMMMLIQFKCTMLCTEELRELLDSLKELEFTPGKEFNLLIVSIDPREKPDFAAEFKQEYLKKYGRPESAAGFHFLTGEKREIDRLSEAVGYRYYYDQHTDQYAHPDGVIIATPQGKLARYYFGLNYPARDLRFGLIEAASERIGSFIDAIALLCFHYNPAQGKYGLVIMSVVRLAGIATVLLIAFGITMMKLRDRTQRRRGDAALEAEG
ncbi:MAG: SCO family protein [Armatimonadota bacterium]